MALGEVGTRAYREDENGDVWVECPKPYLLFADYEAVTDAAGVQSPILVCAEGVKVKMKTRRLPSTVLIAPQNSWNIWIP